MVGNQAPKRGAGSSHFEEISCGSGSCPRSVWWVPAAKSRGKMPLTQCFAKRQSP